MTYPYPERRLIIQSVDTNMTKWLDLSRPIHESYASQCGADYHLHYGLRDPNLHPAWNRIIMFLEAFTEGYDMVVWLDADTLVINPTVNIFTSLDPNPNAPIHMMWAGLPWPGPTPIKEWRDSEWEGKEYSYNNGVLAAMTSGASVDMFTFCWDHRHSHPLPHHAPGMWEGNWLLDWALHNRHRVQYLHQRFNRMPFTESIPEEDAVIVGYHGMPHKQRWEMFQEAYSRYYV